MAARIVARAPWVTALVAAFLVGTAALTAAAAQNEQPAKGIAVPAAPAGTLVVPDVGRQVYVFAKGTLEQAGFAWRVEGAVRGYAANFVASQSPAAGARVVADGRPIVVLHLQQNPSYKQTGSPQSSSPYAGTPARLVGGKVSRNAASAPAAKPAAKPAKKPAAKPAQKPAAKPAARPAAFVVAGAPREPLKEIPLTERAKQLAAWLEKHPTVSDANVRHWLYQHSWVVTGAELGWWRGAEALKTLIAVDRRAQQLWGLGAKSEQAARQALAQVQARAR